MAGITQWYKGAVELDGVLAPALAGADFNMPENYQWMPIASNNTYRVNFYTDLQHPVVSVPLAVALNPAGTDCWMTAAKLIRWLVTRDAVYDDTLGIENGVKVSDGSPDVQGVVGALNVLNPKVAQFSLGVSLAAPVDARLTIWGTDIEDTTITAARFINPGATSRNCHFGGGFDDTHRPVRVELAWNMMPMINPEMPVDPGTWDEDEPWHEGPHPSEINCGMPDVIARVTMQSHIAPPSDGDSFWMSVAPPGGTAVTFLVNNPQWMGYNQRRIQQPRGLKQYTVICRGQEGGGEPITIT